MEKLVLTTPIGKSEWFSLMKTDKFGNYTCDLILEDEPATHKLLSQIKDFAKGEKINFVKKLEDGRFKLRMRLKSQGTKKDGTTYQVNPPAIYNAMGGRVSGTELASLSVGNGSEIRAKIQLALWSMAGRSGVSCKPLSVQIKTLVQFNGDSADLGFDALEVQNCNVETEEQEQVADVQDEYDF